MTKEEYVEEIENIRDIVEGVVAKLGWLAVDADDVEGVDRSRQVDSCKTDAEGLIDMLEGITIGLSI